MANNSKMTTIEQGRAQKAYEFVETMKKKSDKKVWEEYSSGVKKLPVLIKTNGLGQALAFIKNRNTGLHAIYEDLTKWLKIPYPRLGSDLVKYVVNQNSPEYRHLTIEVLGLLNWMRRFVDGMSDDKSASRDDLKESRER